MIATMYVVNNFPTKRREESFRRTNLCLNETPFDSYADCKYLFLEEILPVDYKLAQKLIFL